jgi:lambda family phage portal protein
MARRTEAQLAENAEARLRKERARLELEEVKTRKESLRLKRDGLKSRRKSLAIHRAAEQNRLTADWIAPATSADSAIVADMARTNARARQLLRDDPWAKSIQRAFRRNIVGTGITPSIDGKPWRQAWNAWANDPAQCDVEGRRTFHQMQQWCSDEQVAVGQCFIVRWVINGQLKLQLFEFEQLDQYKYLDRNTDNEIRNGIEVDEYGKAVAFHFYRRHPNDIRGLARPAPLTLDSMRIPASMVCHIFNPDRCRQTHALTWMAPILRNLRDLAEYDASQLRVARAEASIGMIIKGGDDGDDPLSLDGLSVAYVNEDEDVKPFIPSRPGNTYDPFVKVQVMRIAAGVGLSPDQITRSFDGGNFSSKRQASIEDRREFEPLQQQIISQLCRPVMEDWLFTWAMANPEQSGSYFIADDPEEVEWMGQGWEWVDPEAQGKGVERMMRLGLTNRTIEANKLGRSVEKLDVQAKLDGTQRVIDNTEPDKRQDPAIEEVANAD